MYLGAAKAIAELVSPEDLDREHIIPSVFDPRVSQTVKSAVCQAAEQDGVARIPTTNN